MHLVRHGEPEGAGRLLGSSDPPLTAHGRAQAAAIHLRADRIFASTLRRAAETATICANGQLLTLLPALAEISLGDWNGLAWEEIERGWPALAPAKLQDWFGITPPNGESWHEFTVRIDSAFEAATNTRNDTAIIAHLTVNSWIAHRLTGCDPLKFRQGYAQVYTYEF